MEKLDRLVETGSLDDGQRIVDCENSQGNPCIETRPIGQADPESLDGFSAILPMEGRERALLEQEAPEDHVHLDDLPGSGGRERALLEQDEYQAVEDLFDRDWIIEFRQSMPPVIGLIWAGSLENRLREAG